MAMKLRTVLIGLVALLGGAAALALVAGPKTEAGISFFVEHQQLQPGERVAFRFRQEVGWRNASARPARAGDQGYDYRLVPGVPVQVEARLLSGDRLLAQVTKRVPTGGDRRYIIHVHVQPGDPTQACMGCGQPVSAPIPSRSGRLWLYDSFNGISRPIIF